jgi:hypothetical protein
MKKDITEIAGRLLIALFSVTIVFHVLVLIKIIPYEIVWGGRITDPSQLPVFEGASILLNMLFIFIVAVRIGLLRIKFPPAVLSFSLWFMLVIFLLNTVGNIFAESSTETWIFTPITLIISILCCILIFRKRALK